MSRYSLDYQTQHKKSAIPYSIPGYLLLGGGPTNVSNRVLKAFASQPLNPVCDATYKIMEEVKHMIQYVFQTTNPLTLAIQTSGNGGIESLMANLLNPGDRLVVAVSGVWGDVAVEMSQRYHLDVFTVKKIAETFSVEELEAAVTHHRAHLLFVVHAESSTGIVQNLDGIGAMCHKHDCLLAVDAISSIAVHPIFVDRWEIDAVAGGSQKGIGAMPGICMLSFSAKAQKRMEQKIDKPPFYLDVNLLASYWSCSDEPRMYHYTFASNLLTALREALAEICEEGLEQVWARHETNAKLLWKRLEELGLELCIEKPEERFVGITCTKFPKNIDRNVLLDYVKDKFAIDFGTCGDDLTFCKVMRFGLLGQNSRPEVVDYVVEAFKDALQALKP